MTHDPQTMERIYEERLKVLPVTYRMEQRGVTLSGKRLQELRSQYREESGELGERCLSVAAEYDYDLKLPKGSSLNDSMRSFFWDVLKLPIKLNPKTKRPALDKNVMQEYLLTVKRGTMAWVFLTSWQAKKKRDTSVSYMDAYERFAVKADGDVWVLHPNLNPTGTDTLRFSSKNPNSQNISKQESECERCDGEGCGECHGSGMALRSLKYVFGPAEGREWYSFDARGIEDRLPAYRSGQQELIDIFERPDEPPYFGSNHYLRFHTVYPEVWERHPEVWTDQEFIKKRYKATEYQWCKNGGFACVPLTTKALTKSGWKSYEELSMGEEVLGYENGNMRWTPVRRKVLLHNADLVEISNKHFTAVTTPDHRWVGRKRTGRGLTKRYVENFCTSETIKGEQTLYLSAPTASERSLEITDDESAFIGMVLGDGTADISTKSYGPSRGNGSKVGFRVRIYQTKLVGVEWVDNLLKKMGVAFKRYERATRPGNYVWSFDSKQMRSLWRRAGIWQNENYELMVINMSTSQRNAFLEGIFTAEGHTDSKGGKIYTQNKGPIAEAIRTGIFMSGRFATTQNKSSVCVDIRESSPTTTGQRIKQRELDGKHSVWCVSTDLSTWVMRQGDTIALTGNCQYGAIDRADGGGTADRAFHKRGAHRLLKERFSKLEALNQECIRHATKTGFVYTFEDRSIGAKHGYPLFCTRTNYGRVLETVPLNYVIQGSAMWWTMKAMIRVGAFFERLNRGERFAGRVWRGGYYLCLQVHDEIVCDMPRGNTADYNKPIADEVRRLMAMGGELDYNIPTPTGCEHHLNNWAVGE